MITVFLWNDITIYGFDPLLGFAHSIFLLLIASLLGSFIIRCIFLLDVEGIRAEGILVDGVGRVEVVAVKLQRVDWANVDLVDADDAVPEPRLVLDLEGIDSSELIVFALVGGQGIV